MTIGHTVIVADNLFSGSMHNIQQWVGHPNFEFLRHDIVDPLVVEVDQIYHLACPASPKFYKVCDAVYFKHLLRILNIHSITILIHSWVLLLFVVCIN